VIEGSQPVRTNPPPTTSMTSGRTPVAAQAITPTLNTWCDRGGWKFHNLFTPLAILNADYIIVMSIHTSARVNWDRCLTLVVAITD
jgi:hypothetical protein